MITLTRTHTGILTRTTTITEFAEVAGVTGNDV